MMANLLKENFKQPVVTLSSIKQAVKTSVQENQIRNRENLLLRKRLKADNIQNNEASMSKEDENQAVVNAVTSLKKGNKLNALSSLQRLFASHPSTADIFLKQDGLQPLHSCFRSANVEILHTAAWCFVNLAATYSSSNSSYTRLLGLAPTLLQFVKGSDLVMQDLCVWGLANLAGDGAQAADVLHVQGCTDAILSLLEQCNAVVNEERLRNVLFALINMASSSSACAQRMYSRDIHLTLEKIMKVTSLDSTLNLELGWLACSLCPGPHEHGSSLNAVCVPMMTSLISTRLNQLALVAASHSQFNDKLYFPYIRCLSNLVVTCDPTTVSSSRVVLDDITSFSTFATILASASDWLKLEVLILLNNCSVDVPCRVLLALQPDVLSRIFTLCENGAYETRIQAFRLIQSMTRISSHVDCFLLNQGIATPLIGTLSTPCMISSKSNDQLAICCKLAAHCLLDLWISLPDLTKEKVSMVTLEPTFSRISPASNVVSRLQSIHFKDTEQANQIGRLIHHLFQTT